MIIKKTENIESNAVLEVPYDTGVTHLFRKSKCIVIVVEYVTTYKNMPYFTILIYSKIKFGVIKTIQRQPQTTIYNKTIRLHLYNLF